MREKAKKGMEVDSEPPEAASLGTLKRDDRVRGSVRHTVLSTS